MQNEIGYILNKDLQRNHDDQHKKDEQQWLTININEGLKYG